MNHLNLNSKIEKALLEDFKISTFTPIQEKIIPLILNNRNTVGISDTGSGKTLSYLIPCMNQIINRPKKHISLLVITPTKELSQQILQVVKKLARHTTLISSSLFGGTSFNEQTRMLNKGVHILVACPGRLKDHIEKNTIDLSGVQTVVLDEADQLLDMGFLPDITFALNASINRSNTHLFSATFSEEVKSLTKDFLSEFEMIELQNTVVKKTINEFFCPIKNELKYPFLRFLLKHKKMKAVLVFTRTKDEAQKLGEQLVKDKYQAVILQGDMTTHQRQKAIASIKQKNASILVATDVASRGIDISHISHVINYNPPESFESYIHRIGRSARHDLQGEAITLFTTEEHEQLLKIMGDKKISTTKFEEFNYQLKIEKRHQKIF